MVARVSARIFVGPTVCRNEEWLRVSTKYTENVFVTAIALRLFPSFLHPLVALFLPSRWHVQANLGAAKRIISPIVRGRRVAEARDASYKKPEDLLQWMMDTARPNTREGDPDELAHRQLLLSLASIHTTTMALVHVLYDLCARPDFLEPLRDEITTVLLAEGKNGLCWQQNTLQKLRKLDSFIKESQRFSPLSHCKLPGCMIVLSLTADRKKKCHSIGLPAKPLRSPMVPFCPTVPTWRWPRKPF